jgi:hypothetical protein
MYSLFSDLGERASRIVGERDTHATNRNISLPEITKDLLHEVNCDAIDQ